MVSIDTLILLGALVIACDLAVGLALYQMARDAEKDKQFRKTYHCQGGDEE